MQADRCDAGGDFEKVVRENRGMFTTGIVHSFTGDEVRCTYWVGQAIDGRLDLHDDQRNICVRCLFLLQCCIKAGLSMHRMHHGMHPIGRRVAGIQGADLVFRIRMDGDERIG